MDLTLWILAGLLAFLASGVVKLTRSKEKRPRGVGPLRPRALHRLTGRGVC